MIGYDFWILISVACITWFGMFLCFGMKLTEWLADRYEW